MELKHEIKKSEGRISLSDGDKEAGYADYRILSDGLLHLEHTVVDPAYRGGGIGGKLVEAVVEYCRKTGRCLLPVCSYAAKLVDRNAAWQEVTDSENVFSKIAADFEAMASPEKAAHLCRFFKTGKGEYGEGDIFLGITVPQIRAYERELRPWPLASMVSVLHDRRHELRLLALIGMCERFKRSKSGAERKEIYSIYLRNAAGYVNNWDLVDLSCRDIVGGYLAKQPQESDILDKLAASSNLWEQRIAMVSTWELMRQGSYAECIRIANELCNHPHDLIQKAVGWMLRELGKRAPLQLSAFLDNRAGDMARTALRYALERQTPQVKHRYMQMKTVSGN